MNTTNKSDGFFADEAVKETELSWAAKYARKLFNAASATIESLRLRIEASKDEATAYTDNKISHDVYPAINNASSSVNAAARAYTDETAQKAKAYTDEAAQTARAYTDSTAESLQADINKRLQIVQLGSSADLNSLSEGLYYTRVSNANGPGVAGLLLDIKPYGGAKAQYIFHDFGAIYFRNLVQGVWSEWSKKI